MPPAPDENPTDKDSVPGNQASPSQFGSQQLREAEEESIGRGKSSTDTGTTKGKVRYSSKKPEDSEAGELSSSTAGGTTKYSSKPGGADSGSLYNSSATAPGKISFKSMYTRRRAVIAGAIAGAAVITVVGFFALIPLKILHIVNNLQDHFYASSENAVDNETDQLFSNYLKRYVLPSITKCKGTIDKDCTPKAISGTNMVSQLYKSWSNNKLEYKLAENYGLQFRYEAKTGRYFMLTKQTTGDGVDVTGFENSSGNESLDNFLKNSSDPEFKQVSRSEIRQAVKDSFSTETRYKQVFYRYKVGRLLEEKYGIKRCIFACTLKDNFSEWKTEKKNAAKAIIAQRVLEPRSTMLGTALACLYDPNCDPNKIDDSGNCTVGVDCEAHGEDDSEVEKSIQSKLDALAAKYGSEDVLALYNDLVEKGFTQYVIEQILGEEAGQTASKAIPVVGWINLAATAVGDVSSAPKKIEKLSYVINSSTMVATYATYRTFADEQKDPNAPKDATLVGSMLDSLSPNDNSKSMGGTAGAEQTPLYSELIDGSKSAGSKKYTCNNGKPVPAGQSVCSEMQLNNTNNIADALNNIKSNFPGFGILSKLASFWNDTIGAVTGFLGGLLQYIPGFGTLGDLINKIASPLIQAFIQWIFPAIASDTMSGGRSFDLMAGGADVSGNDYAHNGLGGQQLSDQQVAAILNEQQQEKTAQQSNESVIARMFDSNSDNSLVTKLAMMTPTSFSGASNSVASFFSNPFRSFGSIFSLGHVQAAEATADPFGVTQYGYPAGDSIFSSDPEIYWTQNCSTDGTTIDMSLPINAKYHLKQQDGGNVIINPKTQMPENTTTDPCFLIQAAVGSAGGLFDSGLLTTDEQADLQ